MFHFRLKLKLALGVLFLLTIVAPAKSQITFDIQLTYNGDSQYQAAFDAAEAMWERIITDWTDGSNIVNDNGGNSFYNIGDNLSSMFINADVEPIDGSGGILGSAGPTELVNDGSVWLATHGNMRFDVADMADLAADGTLEDVILHEMAHVIGMGTLWSANNLYINNSGQYTGANGLAQYQIEFDSGATSVPVELDGGAGTANGHWDEGSQTVVDTNNVNFGRPLSAALLTGTLDTNDPYISNTTGGALQDLGYDIDFAAIQGVPEPSSAILLSIMAITLVRRRK